MMHNDSVDESSKQEEMVIVDSQWLLGDARRTDEIERMVWEQVESILVKPDVIIAELERRRQAMNTNDSLEDKLRLVSKHIEDLHNREMRLIRLYTYSEFDDDSVRKEKSALNALSICYEIREIPPVNPSRLFGSFQSDG